MRFDLKRPCKMCPFANTPNRIVFACRERAEEIEELAYREGFVCHEHAEHVEESEYEAGGYVFKEDGQSQHCVGALIMHMDGGGTVQWQNAIEEDEGLEDRWWGRVDKAALGTVFADEEEFFEANDN